MLRKLIKFINWFVLAPFAGLVLFMNVTQAVDPLAPGDNHFAIFILFLIIPSFLVVHFWHQKNPPRYDGSERGLKPR